MTKRKTMLSVYTVNGVNGKYTVTLESLRNTPSGNARYRAVIIYNNGYNAVYTFTGHCYSPFEECKWITKFHEDHENDI